MAALDAELIKIEERATWIKNRGQVGHAARAKAQAESS